MKLRFSAPLLIVAALAVAGIAYSEATPTGLPKHDAVFGGGQFLFPLNNTVRNFSVTAGEDGGTLQYSVSSARVGITCSRIAGNAAVVGGVIRDATNASIIGLPAVMYFVDSGPPSGASVRGDTVSPLGIFGPGEDPGGLPKTCPAVDPSQATQTLNEGDIVVHDEKP